MVMAVPLQAKVACSLGKWTHATEFNLIYMYDNVSLYVLTSPFKDLRFLFAICTQTNCPGTLEFFFFCAGSQSSVSLKENGDF